MYRYIFVKAFARDITLLQDYNNYHFFPLIVNNLSIISTVLVLYYMVTQNTY